jgi:dipeptidyl aminopeptidase/acylaminoacyl peptidase
MHRTFRRLIAPLLLILVCAGAWAAPPSIEDLVKLPQYSRPVLSENGKYIAVAVPRKGYMNLAVIDLETRKATLITDYDDLDVVWYEWIGSDRLVWSNGQRDATASSSSRRDGGGLFTATREAKEFRVIGRSNRGSRFTPVFSRGAGYIGRVDGSETDFLAVTHERSARSQDIYRVNASTGETTLVTFDRPDNVFHWVLDRKGVPRVAVSYVIDELPVIVSYRASETAPWVELFRFDRSDDMTMPLYVDDDGSLIVASNVDRDTTALFRYDPKTRTRGEQLVQHPRFDIGVDEELNPRGHLIVDARSLGLVGLEVVTAKPEKVFFDERHARLQKAIDAALPDTRNSLSGSAASHRHIVTASSDRQPPRYYLYDEDKRSLEELFASRPWLAPDQLAEMKPVFYKTRDGFEQLAYLMLPISRKPGERLPLVIHVHGGPWVPGDQWGFFGTGVAEGQILASKGYAVLLPNFRGTTGFGKRQYRASFLQVGKAMQEDIEDAGDWAVKEGYADPDRICLSGASYGGYAALMGPAKTPDKYRCAIAGLAVTDWELLLTSSWGDSYYNEIGQKWWLKKLGDPVKDRDALRAVSPVYLADRIKAPVLIYAGTDDIRVPIEQMKNMRAALAQHGRSVVWIQKDDERHGFGSVENRLDLYRQVVEFLDKNDGPRAR